MKNQIKDQIIDLIRRNRISTTEIADCMDKSGSIQGIKSINRLKFAVGPVKWVYGYNESNWEVHEQIQDTKKGEIVIVELFNCKDRAVFGSLVAKYLILYQQCAGIVVLGNVRDAHTLIKEDYPIWMYGVTPIGCFNKKNEKPMDSEIIKKRITYYKDAIAVCDDSGVVIIPQKEINEKFLEKLEWIENQEDLWFDCIDRRKMNTFETVCLKKYKDQ
jgi:regulator of RNase E activity RraA